MIKTREGHRLRGTRQLRVHNFAGTRCPFHRQLRSNLPLRSIAPLASSPGRYRPSQTSTAALTLTRSEILYCSLTPLLRRTQTRVHYDDPKLRSLPDLPYRLLGSTRGIHDPAPAEIRLRGWLPRCPEGVDDGGRDQRGSIWQAVR